MTLTPLLVSTTGIGRSTPGGWFFFVWSMPRIVHTVAKKSGTLIGRSATAAASRSVRPTTWPPLMPPPTRTALHAGRAGPAVGVAPRVRLPRQVDRLLLLGVHQPRRPVERDAVRLPGRAPVPVVERPFELPHQVHLPPELRRGAGRLNEVEALD